MKYVSLKCTSVASDARNRPVMPPIVNKPIKPSAYNIGVSYEIDPLYKVAVQLKTLIAEGMKRSFRHIRTDSQQTCGAPKPESQRPRSPGSKRQRTCNRKCFCARSSQLSHSPLPSTARP